MAAKRKARKPGVVIKKDGRVVLRTPAQWAKRREEVWERDARKCVRCAAGVPLHDLCDPMTGDVVMIAAEIHHKRGRGLGGSLRDDRLEALETLCFRCHSKHHVPAKVVPAKALPEKEQQ